MDKQQCCTGALISKELIPEIKHGIEIYKAAYSQYFFYFYTFTQFFLFTMLI